jgi:hypothetical protein
MGNDDDNDFFIGKQSSTTIQRRCVDKIKLDLHDKYSI